MSSTARAARRVRTLEQSGVIRCGWWLQMSAYEKFLTGWLSRTEGVVSTNSSFVLKVVKHSAELVEISAGALAWFRTPRKTSHRQSLDIV